LIIFGLLKSKANFSRIAEDFKADLPPTNMNDFARSGIGEVERELYVDGGAELNYNLAEIISRNGLRWHCLLMGQ